MTEDQEIRELIDLLVDKIVREYKPERIILFGSYAYGNPDPDSDLDLLIIKNTLKRPIDRWVEVKKILRDPDLTIPVSPFVYTESELKERVAIKDFFIEEILKKGEILYG